MLPRSARTLFFLIFAIVAALLGFGLYLQHVKGIEPCPLCALQRYAFATLGLIALLGALQGARGWGIKVYSGLMVVACLLGGGIAVRHVYLEHFPPQFAVCGPDLEYMVDSFPLSKALPMIFKGSGDCSQVAWRFLGLSIAEWSLIWFSIFLAVAIWRFLQRDERTY